MKTTRKISTLFSLAVSTGMFLTFASPAFAVPELVGLCHVKGTPTFAYLEVAASAVPAHLGHGDFLYGGPAGTKEVKTAWCNDNRPTPNVPEFGLTTGLMATVLSAGAFVTLRRKFAII